MLRWLKVLIVPGIALSLLTFGLVHMIGAEKVIPQSLPPAVPPRSPFGSNIAGSGIVEPQSENISIGAPLSGVVAEVFIPADRSGTLVHAGDLLFRIDNRHLKAQLAVQEASLSAPRAELAKLELMPRTEEVVPAEYRVTATEAQLVQARDDYERMANLGLTSSVSESEIVTARQALEVAAAQRAQAQAELSLIRAGAWEPDKAIVRAQIQQIMAQIQQIDIEMERSLVRAPIDGIVLQVNVRPGEFVGGTSAESLVVLGDMRQPRIRVDIDENDIPRFDAIAPAIARVRGDSSEELKLKFVRVEPYVVPKRSLTSANTERVDTRVLQVIYEINNVGRQVYVGQQLDVFIAVPDSTLPDRIPATEQ